jgi:uncharacterized protein YhjY with autotransporter beta-barrel domain
MHNHYRTSPARLLKASTAIISVKAAVVAPPLAMLMLLATPGAVPQADAASCENSDGFAAYYCQEYPKPAAPSSNGASGTPGTPAVPAQFNFDARGYGGPAYLEIFAGEGGDGRNSHYSQLGKNGGDGGKGGDGSTLTVTMPVGSQVDGWVSIVSDGGDGGVAGHGSKQGNHGTGGAGGLGGSIVAGTPDAPMADSISTSGTAAITAIAGGGNGAYGVDHDGSGPDGSTLNGGDAGNGGNAQSVSVAVSGTLTGSSLIVATSAGGNGGDGGVPSGTATGNQGGNGGNGGKGSNVNVWFSAADPTATNVSQDVALRAGSYGGAGGAGGPRTGSASGGNAGNGNDSGTVTVTKRASIQTSNDDAPGIQAQSLGGVGKDGGTGGGFGAGGGAGGGGGNGKDVSVTSAGRTVTSGTNAQGILAQSIGGGGGSGGDASGFLQTVGGAGASAGNGGNVSVQTADTITTSGERSAGVLAQSIGGGGGNGGNASAIAVGPVSMAIGGSGAAGGLSSSVQAANSGTIVTEGLHASGMVLQSIGGGGGTGGSAYSKDSSGGVGVSVALGGSGGDGSNGGPVQQIQGAATNSGVIQTSGANSFGIIGQSIGGGGGVGGSSMATATVHAIPAGDGSPPTVALAFSAGGKGGKGGYAQGVTVQNDGLIATLGTGATGVVAQSIGGGGGSGGDASASSEAKSNKNTPVSISASLAIGGNGGGGGNGAAVNVLNNGMIFTRGESADAVLAQSIGGGGGNAGAGDAKASNSGDATSISTTVGLGGRGGTAGDVVGGVSVTNSGSMLTLGDGASGIMAQAIGGGGGRGGGASGTSSQDFTANVSVGGKGGGGGTTRQNNDLNTAVATVNNVGSILTFGADAPGIVAQSIAGGGGAGGKAASTIGGTKSTGDGSNGSAASTSAASGSFADRFLSGAIDTYKSISNLIGAANQALGNASSAELLGDDPASDTAGDLDKLGETGGDSGDDTVAKSGVVNIGVGGNGGTGGSAGSVQISNSGTIATVGSMSDGILAQGIGGGGGKGGGAISSSLQTTSGDGTDEDGNKITLDSAVGVGGKGGIGGDGGNVAVTNSGSIITNGGLAAGIVAQSIGGGGGMGGVSGAKSQTGSSSNTVLSASIAVGGQGGANGNGTWVTVTNTGSIQTASHDAIGIIAQSIGGGGGIVKTLSTDKADNAGGGASATGGDYSINVSLGGGSSDPKHVTSGIGGTVKVENDGSIVTAGRNAYGILAQAIGGGGGIVLGGKPANGAVALDTTAAVSGDGHDVTVNSLGGIATTGQGAVGIFAQSIGGGGGIAGDTAWTQQLTAFNQSRQRSGSGGPVTINVGDADHTGASVTTGGDNAPAILVQSIGGGGGRVSNEQGAFNGSTGGQGTGGTVTVNVFGTVSATGHASPGIYAASAGGSGASPITINIAERATVSGGYDVAEGDAAAVYVDSGSSSQAAPNVISNNGTITSANGVNGTAISNAVGYTHVENNGTITGQVLMNYRDGGQGTCDGGGTGCPTVTLVNRAGGTINAGAVMDLGAQGSIENHGSISVGGQGTVATTAVTGNLTQGAGGRLVIDSNHRTGESDHLNVQGSVRLAGLVEMHPTVVTNREVSVLSASQGLTLDTGLAASRTQLFRFETRSDGTSLLVKPQAEFTKAAVGLGSNQRGVAAHLQELWDGGVSMDDGFTALAGVEDGQTYARNLSTLSGQTLGAIAAFRYSNSQSFVNTMFGGCDVADGDVVATGNGSCVWSRIIAGNTQQDATGNALGYRANAQTFQFGAEREIAPNLTLGGSFAYEASQFRGDGRNVKISGDGLMAGATVGYRTGAWRISGALDLGYGWFDSRRTVSLGDLMQISKGSPDAWHAGVHTRIAYQIPMGGWYVQPFVDLGATYLRSGAFTETGAGPFNLAVNSQGSTVLSASAAVEVGGSLPLGSLGTLKPFASVGFGVLSDDDWSVRARFADQPDARGFKASTPMPDTVAKFRVGARLASGTNWDFQLQYNADVASNYLSHAGIGRIAYRF